MKKFMTFLMTLLLSIQSANAMNVDDFINQNIAPFTDKIAKIIFFPVPVAGNNVPLIIFWVLFAGIFFTLYLKGISVWGFKHAIDTVTKPA